MLDLSGVFCEYSGGVCGVPTSQTLFRGPRREDAACVVRLVGGVCGVPTSQALFFCPRGRRRGPEAGLSSSAVIAAFHAASGAAAGAATGSRTAAALLGPLVHLAGDAVPHRDIANEKLDIAGGLATFAVILLRRGPLDPATIGAAAGMAPDVEHVIRLPRPGGLKLFHEGRGWHRNGPLSIAAQVALTGFLVAQLVRVESR